ncbi:MAG: alpha-amylase family protein, partial [Phycisphaerae bacterium]
MSFTVVALLASPASAHYQTLTFDLTKNDQQAYTTDIPADAFTPAGLKLPVKKGVTYQLTTTRPFSDEFDYELQVEVVGRGDRGEIYVDVVLVNDAQKRKAIGTYVNSAPGKGADRGAFQYFKDGKAMGFNWNGNWRDSSHTAGYQGAGTVPFEWLRIHKAPAPENRVWFIQRLKGQPYRWDGIADYPKTTYFQEDCDSYKLGFVVRATDDATGTVLIKTMRVSGGAVLPRDPARREFHLDFGPVNQELEDDFMPVNQYTMYTPAKGYGWVVPEYEKVWRGDVPMMTDKEIAEAGFPPPPPPNPDGDNWYISFIRQAYWLEKNDKKVFYSTSHGGDYVEFFKKWLDLKTPLERDFVGMARPMQFAMNHLAQKDIEERRGSLYIDDDLSADFVIDVPNGNYNVIMGLGYSQSLFGGGEMRCMNVDINGRVRKQELGPNWRRTNQFPIRNILVENGKMDFRFFVDVRKCMDPWMNHNLAVGWMINYIVILPAEEKELMNEWEWKIIKRRGEIIRRVTFVEGEPAITRLENKPGEVQAPFISLSGKPYYYSLLQNNYVVGDTDYINYYCLANSIHVYTTVKGSQHFFKPDWEKLSYSDDYPWDNIDKMNVGYTWHCLSALALEDILSFVPHAVQGEGTPTMDARGRRNRYNVQPPLNSALGKEIQKEAYTMMSNQLGLHPAKSSNYIYEELWHPDEQGYDDQSYIQYWDWLRRKYGTIEALDKEWGKDYKGFDDIIPPSQAKTEFWQYTPEFVNFRKFRGWAQEQMVKSACETARSLEPDHITWGAKGDFGTQSYYPGEYLDMFGWYSPEVAASVARRFNKAAIIGGYMLNCEYAYLDGRKQFDHKPGPRRYLGKDEVNTVYNKIVSSVFKGAKGFYNEWYSDGMCHFFHRTAMIRKLAPQYRIIHWTGQLAFYEPGAFEGPPVNMERQALYASCANKMLYRLAPLWLPAKPLEPKVLYPLDETSFFLDFMGAKPYADFEGDNLRILKAANVPADFLNIAGVGDLSKYNLIVIGDGFQAIPKADAVRIRDYVQKGGKLVILNGGGFTYDEKPRRFTKGDEVFPVEEFADLGGYTIAARDRYHPPLGKAAVTFAANDFGPEFA